MKRTIGTSLMAAIVSAALGPVAAEAQVGDPTGFFSLKITHGNTTVLDNPNVPVPADIFLPERDGTPEGFVQIGTIGPMNSPIILKMVSDPDPDFRIVHFYVNVPLSLNQLDLPGPTSLFDPSNPAPITIEVSNLSFTNTTEVTPMIVNNETYLTAFMRDMGGVFYNLPEGNTLNFPGPDTEVQVPGRAFCNADDTLYDFDNCVFGSFDGQIAQPTASFAWKNIFNPGPDTTTNNGFNPNAPSFGSGYVFEIGLSAAFVGVPEPATAGLLALGALPILMRRRRRR